MASAQRRVGTTKAHVLSCSKHLACKPVYNLHAREYTAATAHIHTGPWVLNNGAVSMPWQHTYQTAKQTAFVQLARCLCCKCLELSDRREFDDVQLGFADNKMHVLGTRIDVPTAFVVVVIYVSVNSVRARPVLQGL